MDSEAALKFAERFSGQRPIDIPALYKYIQDTTLKVKELHVDQKSAIRDLKEWGLAWKKLSDGLDGIVRADPILLYVPQNRMAREFHASPAFARMSCSANRTSKTTTVVLEAAGTLTNRDWGRKKLPAPADVFHIGVDFQKYAPNVFEKKLLEGEPGVNFEPLFPEGGKWFNHYDERKKRLTICCPVCAESGRAPTCNHTKSTWTLFSDNEGPKVLQGGAYRVGIYDEEIAEEFWTEGSQRLQTVADSFILIGFTPLLGPEHWPHRRVGNVAKGDPAQNLVDPRNPKSRPFASYHTIGQEEGGLVSPEKVAMLRATMDEAEAAARLDGEPVPIVASPVFPRKIVAEMRKSTCAPTARGHLRLVHDGRMEVFDSTETFNTFTPDTQFALQKDPDANLRIWQNPIPGFFYILAADCAIGLASGDPVCCSVLRVTPGLKGTQLLLAAQYHGWINSFDYAAELMKLAIWYNSGLVVIENSGGYGEAVALKLREFCYWNIYVDEQDRTKTDPSLESRIGVNTNISSKPFMVAALQRLIIERAIDIPCEDTIREMLAFEQARSKIGGTSRYRGAQGSHDDRVMSLCLGAGVAMSYPLYKWETLKSVAEDYRKEHNNDSISPEWRMILEERMEAQEREWE